MTVKYFTLMTETGTAKLANATALGVPLKLTHMAVGDGGGTLPTPNSKQVKLVAEQRRAALNSLSIDSQNASQIIAEQVIPESDGGWWIREIGLFDSDGDLIAVGNCPESYKPQLAEGSGRTQTVRMVIITSSTDNITLKIDPSVVLATRGYVDNLIETRQQKSAVLTAVSELKPAKGKLPYFTGEKAAALADLSDFIRLMLNKGDAAGVLEYLGLGDFRFGAPLIGQRIDWPLELMPQEIWPDMTMEFIPYMAQSFDPVKYPLLAALHPDNKLPADMRGYAPRGWDNGRGIDIDRELMSEQGDAIRNITGSFIVDDAIGSSTKYPPSGAFYTSTKGVPYDASSVSDARGYLMEFSAEKIVPVADENRMKTVAWNMIVRAK